MKYKNPNPPSLPTEKFPRSLFIVLVCIVTRFKLKMKIEVKNRPKLHELHVNKNHDDTCMVTMHDVIMSFRTLRCRREIERFQVITSGGCQLRVENKIVPIEIVYHI